MIKMNEEFEKLFSTLSEKDQKEVANLIRFKNEVKYHDKQFEELLQQYIELSREHDKSQQENQQLKENKEGWQRLANKYFNALEDIKEYLKENEKEYGSLEDNEKIILNIVNKALGSKEDE